MNNRPKRGMALVTALVLMVMMTAIAIKLFTRLSEQISLAMLEQHNSQARWYLASAESLALSTLRQSLATDSRVHLAQPWAAKTHRFPVPQGSIAATLSDMQTCFNINALANPEPEQHMLARKQLLALLSLLAIPAPQAAALEENIWHAVEHPSAREEHADASRRSARVLLVDISELRAAEGMDAGLYKKIAPFICALPDTRQRININTLNEQQSIILAAFFAPGLSAGEARTLIQQRPQAGWESVEEFLNQSIIANVDSTLKTQLKNVLSVESRYFQLLAEIKFAETRLFSRSLIARATEKQFSVLWHQTGEPE